MKTFKELADSLGGPHFLQMSMIRNSAGVYALQVAIRPEDPAEGYRVESHMYFMQESTGRLIEIDEMTQAAGDAALAEALKPV